MRGYPVPMAAAVMLSAGLASASAITYCPSDAGDVCYQVAIPSSTASKGAGDIYFQISAPSTYQWVALGTGTQMPGSNMFIMYQDGAGNLTLSPRHGANHVMPTLDTSSTAAKLTLLAGSGVSGSQLTANVKCSNCETWTGGGSLSVTSTNSPWIAAWRVGSSLATTSTSAVLTQHDNTAQFELDLTKATVSSDSNPFLSSGSNPTTSSGGGGGGGGGVTVTAANVLNPNMLTAHGLIMALVMVVLYPLGAMLMPVVGKWFIHGAWQAVSYLAMWAGFALGVLCARERNLLYTGAGTTHTVIGTIAVTAMGIQPALGLLHHRHYVRHQSRGGISYLHMWWGRTVLVLGAVNGGLGLQLAGASAGIVAAYAAIAAVVYVVYAAVKVFTLLRSRRGGRAGSRGSKESLGHSEARREAQLPRRPHAEHRRSRDREPYRYEDGREGYA